MGLPSPIKGALVFYKYYHDYVDFQYLISFHTIEVIPIPKAGLPLLHPGQWKCAFSSLILVKELV